MNFRILKKARVLISLIFFLLITFVFIDFANALTANMIRGILYLQFIPSLISFLGLAGMAAAGFIFVAASSLIFGRIYCSTLCPLGTMQDIIIWLNRKFRKKKVLKKQRSYHALKYTVLFLVGILFVFGLITPLLFFDPYSNFGRIIANTVRPVYLFLNNLGATALESVDVYTLYRVEPGVTHWFSITFSLLLLVLIVWLSVKHARLFCNTLCPLGALLGLLSRYSLFRISLEQNLCTSCGKCSAVCKAGCIDISEKKVDFSQCVGCLNCLTSCPSNGVLFTLKGRKSAPVIQEYDPTRRNILSAALAATTTMAAMPLLALQQRGGSKKCKSPQEVIRNYPVSPPGSVSLRHFNDSCTACHLCVSACPTHVIKPSFLEYGLAGIMQPRMDYLANYCNFDCITCSEVCPTGALQPLSIDEKHVLQLGKVNFIKYNCIVYTEGTDCGACSEHCPTKAVDMRPYMDKLFLPVVDPEICVGCGACEYACPTDPKSIYVDGNPLHLVAEVPQTEKLEQPDPEEDFPF
ncbi:MAG: 4Fe-4S binding protein [Bacteroidota bacterium]